MKPLRTLDSDADIALENERELPLVARVMVDVPLSHLHRPFDFSVPAEMRDEELVGRRVRVRFAGRLTDGWVVETATSSKFSGELKPLTRLSGPRVLSDETMTLVHAVGEYYAGSFIDVVRSAVPPRHASVEKLAAVVGPDNAPGEQTSEPPQLLRQYQQGARLHEALQAGDPIRGVITVSPSDDISELIAEIAALSARPCAVVAPDYKDVDKIAHATTRRGLSPTQLRSDLSPARRYRNFLDIVQGRALTVIGTRSAVFAPLATPVVIVVEDGDDLHRERHAPGWHSREVAGLRSQRLGASVILVSRSMSTEAYRWVATGWATHVVRTRAQARESGPLVVVSGDDPIRSDPQSSSARLPHDAWQLSRQSLAQGPVLLSVSRTGYVPVLSCAGCSAGAVCPHCLTGLGLAVGGGLNCPKCLVSLLDWACPECGARQTKHMRKGSLRTAAELARSIAGASVVISSSDADPDPDFAVKAWVPQEPALVVATPGAEPSVEGGYAAAILLDAHSELARPSLRAGEDCLRRWLTIASLVRPRSSGGKLMVIGPRDASPVRSLISLDPVTFAEREFEERRSAGMPPAVRLAAVLGAPQSVAEFLAAAELPTRPGETSGGFSCVGSMPVSAQWSASASAKSPEVTQTLVAAPVALGLELASRLARAQMSHRTSSKDSKEDLRVSVRMDPALDWGA